MSTVLFLIVIVSLQAIFIALDFVYLYYKKDTSVKDPLKMSSLWFLIAVAIIYGIIQFGGLALIPKTEILINWAKNILPSLQLVDLGNNLSIFGWILLGIFTFYLSGIWDYVIHRFLSHSRTLFFTHEYHHLPNRLILALPGLSVRPFVVVAILPATIGTVLSLMMVLKVLNLENISLMPLVFAIILIQTVILSITHSEFFMSQWWMYRTFRFVAITSPQEHEMHHTVDLRGNYGNFTMLWDKLFGTYIDPTKTENQNHALGLSYDQDFLGALTAGKIKLPKHIRDTFQVDRFCNTDTK